DGLADGNDAHGVGVFLAEDGPQAVDLPADHEGNHVGVDGQVLLDQPADHLLDLGELFGRHGPGGVEVEAQAVGCDQRALLVGVVAQRAAQGEVHHVGGGVVGGGVQAPGVVDV